MSLIAGGVVSALAAIAAALLLARARDVPARSYLRPAALAAAASASASTASPPAAPAVPAGAAPTAAAAPEAAAAAPAPVAGLQTAGPHPG
jgi:hypothetical protein